MEGIDEPLIKLVHYGFFDAVLLQPQQVTAEAGDAADDVATAPAEMAAFVESFVRELPPTSALGFRAGLWTLAGAARLRGRALDAEELRRLESSRLAPLRLSVRVVCGLGLMALYSAPGVRQKLELP